MKKVGLAIFCLTLLNAIAASAESSKATSPDSDEALAAPQEAAADSATKKANSEPGVAGKVSDEKKSKSAARGLDSRIRRLSDRLARNLKSLDGDHRDQVFAVVQFDDEAEEAKDKQLGLVVSDLVVTNLVKDHRISLVERAKLSEVIKEIELGQAGAINPDQAAEYGSILGVRALIVGKIVNSGQSFKITARIMDAETGRVLGTEDASVPKEELIAVSKRAVVLRTKTGAMFRSAVAPGWGQLYNDEPVKAAVAGTAVGIGVVSTIAAAAVSLTYVALLLTWSRDDTTTNKEHEDAFPAMKSVQQTTGIAAGILGGLTVAIWAGVVADAYLSGTDVDDLQAAKVRE